MNVSATVTLEQGEALRKSGTDAATAILEALGGDPAVDHCAVAVMLVEHTVVGPSMNGPSDAVQQPAEEKPAAKRKPAARRKAK